jgi:ElaB/YqjD/DUF883 family membrane-anchored ribosome-binding protein
MPSNGQPKAEPRTPAAVRAEIERTREELATSVSALRQEVAQATDWRLWVQKRPLMCVGAAFMIGFIIGSRR